MKRPAAEFAAKIDHEGGIDDALDYGLKAEEYDLPDNIREAWEFLQALHKIADPYAAEIYEWMEEMGL